MQRDPERFNGPVIIGAAPDPVEVLRTDGSVATWRDQSNQRDPQRFNSPAIVGREQEGNRTVEVCRSFAYKMSLQHYGGPQFESVDLFSSRKTQCATEDQEWVSQQIFEECVEEVRAAVAGVANEIKRKNQRRISA